MIYALAADAVLVLHLMFIVFVVLGALLVLRWRWIAVLQIPAALWGAATELCGLICPLTPLERSLRRLAEQGSYTEDFIEHYLAPVVYPAGLTPTVQYWLGALVALVNVGVYVWIWSRARGRRSRG